jgi:hypothetical protein
MKEWYKKEWTGKSDMDRKIERSGIRKRRKKK